MRKLQALLRNYSSPVVAGDSGSRLQMTALRSDLSRLRAESTSWFALCVVVFLAIFLGQTGLLLLDVVGPGAAAGTTAATGASLVGLAMMIFRLWREKVAIDLLMVLLVALDEDAVRSIVDVLARKLR